MKKERELQLQRRREESSDESELGFGDDDDDTDDDYEDVKPWQKDRASRATAVSRLDKGMEVDDGENDEAPKPRDRPDKSAASPEAGLESFLKITIPRRRLARWCNEPFFEKAVMNCFVRLFIGENDSGEKFYRLCEIIDVKVGKASYKLPVSSSAEVPVSTSKMLRLKFGNSEKDFPLYLISDAPPDEVDVQKYISNQKSHRLHILNTREVNRLYRMQEIHVKNYTYTTEDIERNLENRKIQGKSAANLGLEQTKVEIALKAAAEAVEDCNRRLGEAKRLLMESDNNVDEAELAKDVEEAQRQLENAQKQLEIRQEEEQATKSAVQDRKRRLTQRSKDINWAKVNERALLANQRADRDAEKLREETVSGSGQKKAFNPYARRRVKPKILWEVGQKDEGDSTKDEPTVPSTEAEPEKTPAQITVAPSLVQESSHASKKDRHQFVIDEESLVQASSLDALLGGSRRTSARKNRVRIGISLQEYLDRKEKDTL